MGGIDIGRLGKRARQQIAEALARPPNAPRQKRDRPPAAGDFDSKGEEYFYMTQVYPLLRTGRIAKCELHREFELYPPLEYCGVKLPGAVFKPDFVLHYATGTVEVVEIKSKFTRRQSRDYTLRRRLFIDRHCRPNGWLWREIITDKED